MSKAKHTPGPWECWDRYAPNARQLSCRGEVGGFVVHGPPREDGSYYAPICDGLSEADARLIAAGPELLDALKDLLAAEWMVTHDWGGDRPAVIEQAEAAVRKVEHRNTEPMP